MTDALGAGLEGLRKQAKRWLKALRAGDVAAMERLARVLPKHAEQPGLREVQQALAREHGFASWAALKEHVEVLALEQGGDDSLVDEFLQHACIFSGGALDFPSKWRRADRILVRHPEIGRSGIHAAAVCGDLEHVAALLAKDPQLVGRRAGPQAWEPLSYVCYGRLSDARVAQNSVAIAELLLDRGADPNTFCLVGGLRFTALTGVMGQGEMGAPEHPCADDLARLLLDRGASPNDSQGLYNTHLVGDETKWLELLFRYGLDEYDRINWDAEPPASEPGPILDYLLPQAAALGHVKRLRCLLERGADPNARSSYNGKTCYQAALVSGRLDVADLLLRHGADREPLGGCDAFVSACNLGDAAAAHQLLRNHPEYLTATEPLIDAARGGRLQAAKLLLELGMDPNVPGIHGHLPLHVACEDERMTRLLLQHGADPRGRCYGGSATSWARHAGNSEMARFHAANSRELADAVMAGHVGLVEELVREDPQCVRSRSASGNTALHVLPEDPGAARRIIDMLLAHGADPTATNDDDLTPAQALEAQGLDTIADLLEVAVDAGR
jgi:uncharacterized protein